VNGPHDLGGQMGFGPVAPEPDEPRFHGDWEKHALALTLACGFLGAWTLDESRHARESLHPADYYASSYYEIWIKALETLLVRHGFITAEELAAGEPLTDGAQPKRLVKADEVPGILGRGGPVNRAAVSEPRFAVGAVVRTVNRHLTGHTRLPRYTRDKIGVIEAVRGCHVFPDSHAHGAGEQPQWLYSVTFAGKTLWGEGCDPKLSVSIDAWENYLEPA
jgi:nitrile hydratase